MANLIVVDVWKKQALTFLLSGGSPGYEMGIFTNSALTWANNTAVGTLTEPGFTGYARQPCLSWTSPALDGSTPPDAYSNGTAVSWTNNDVGSTTVYGVFYNETSTNTLVAGQNFAAPVVMTTGVTLSLVPEMQTQSQF